MQHEHDMSGGELTEHEFDGIREYDNPTPGWWHLIFFGSIVFSALYFVFFTGELGWTPISQHERAKARYFERLFGQIGQLQPDEGTMLSLMSDEKWMTVGKTIFVSNCAQCHGSEGGGINGANLTDDSYIHVKKLTDIYSTVSAGVVAKGMPAWSNRLNENQRIMVSAYVATLRGRNVPGKGPEENATPIPAWPPMPAQDAGSSQASVGR
jgi:cytochrome c oxidase cbb3-type subunit 3